MARLIRVCPDCNSPVEMCVCPPSFDEWLARKKEQFDEAIAEALKNNEDHSKCVRSWNAEFFELINAQNVEWIAVQIHAGAMLRIFD